MFMIDVNSERSLFFNAFLSTQIMNIILKIGDPVLPVALKINVAFVALLRKERSNELYNFLKT